MPAEARDARPDYLHVADLASIQRSANSEVRVRLVESRTKFAIELRTYERSRHSAEMIASGHGVFIPAERLAETMLALDRAKSAISALRGAA